MSRRKKTYESEADWPSRVKAEETTTVEEMEAELAAENECEECGFDPKAVIDPPADEEEDQTEGGVYQLVNIDEILNIENEAMFRTVEPKLIEPVEAVRLQGIARELVRKAVSGSEIVPMLQIRHWQKIAQGQFPWGWSVEEE